MGAEKATAVRLLIGYEGRTGSRDALAFARAICEKAKVEITVASVRPYRTGLTASESLAMAILEDERWIGRGAGRELGPFPFTARAIPGGQEATVLKELSQAEGSDMIVLGSTHRSPVGRVLPGGVGRRVLDGAACAVVVAPRGLSDAKLSIERIVVGYDGSRASGVALDRAIELAALTDASLLILGAVEVATGSGADPGQPEDRERARIERHLERALASVPEALSAESRVLVGPADATLIEAARSADLLVLGSRGSFGVVRQLELGNVGKTALESASCTTLVTPPIGEPA